MANITYLFGAGASAQSLPVVSDIPDRINRQIGYLREYNSADIEKQELNNLINDLGGLREVCLNHATVDTYAKKLYVTNQKDQYKKLKLTLSTFLTIEQILNLVDKRYDSFLASIIPNEGVYALPPIKILSWNYDCQFELAGKEYFLGSRTLLDVQGSLNLSDKVTSKTDDADSSSFSMIKLNGSALLWDKNRKTWFEPYFDTSSMQSLDYMIRLHWMAMNADVQETMSFAWEQMPNRFYGSIKGTVVQTDILVVIGYSFPFFNRDVDREIISSMPNLHKVYIQDPNASDIIQTFQAITPSKDIELVPITDTRQFFLPYEL